MLVFSREPLSSQSLDNIKRIFAESNCPYESLRNSFPNFSGLSDGKIFFDDTQSAAQEFSSREDLHKLVRGNWNHARLCAVVI